MSINTYKEKDYVYWCSLHDFPYNYNCIICLNPEELMKEEVKPQWSYLPKAALDEVTRAWHLSNSPTKEHPNGKYAKHNWRNNSSMSWAKNYDSMQHHLTDYGEGKDFDKDTKRYMLAHLICRALMALEMQIKGTGTDDRYKEDS